MDLRSLTNDIEGISETYTSKYNIERTPDWFMLKLQEEVGEVTQAYLMMTQQARTKDRTAVELENSFAEELADALCHILLLAKHYNIIIEDQIDKKWLIWRNGQDKPIC